MMPGPTIAIASGKGGTGKTTLAVNLALVTEHDVRLLDCDVEEPNLHLFLNARARGRQPVAMPVPRIREAQCTGCGDCVAFCQFGALLSFGQVPTVFAELCHGCGGCTRVCRQKAIREVDRRIGTIESFTAGTITLIQGRMDVGVALAPPIIHAVKREARGGLAIVDAPPGASCPAIAALQGVDYAILVAEPTPFGLNDLSLAVAMVRGIGIPFGVVINRATEGARLVHDYCDGESIDILAEIPNDRRIAESYAHGVPMVAALPEYRERIGALLRTVLAKVGAP